MVLPIALSQHATALRRRPTRPAETRRGLSQKTYTPRALAPQSPKSVRRHHLLLCAANFALAKWQRLCGKERPNAVPGTLCQLCLREDKVAAPLYLAKPLRHKAARPLRRVRVWCALTPERTHTHARGANPIPIGGQSNLHRKVPLHAQVVCFTKLGAAGTVHGNALPGRSPVPYPFPRPPPPLPLELVNLCWRFQLGRKVKISRRCPVGTKNVVSRERARN